MSVHRVVRGVLYSWTLQLPGVAPIYNFSSISTDGAVANNALNTPGTVTCGPQEFDTHKRVCNSEFLRTTTGIEPDTEVDWSCDALRAGSDTQLQKAIEVVESL